MPAIEVYSYTVVVVEFKVLLTGLRGFKRADPLLLLGLSERVFLEEIVYESEHYMGKLPSV
jgi:hypothetical protein